MTGAPSRWRDGVGGPGADGGARFGFPAGYPGASCRRHPGCGRLPRWSPGHGRGLHRCRRLLRHLRVPHHRPDPRRGGRPRRLLLRPLLRPPGPAAAPLGGARHRHDRGRLGGCALTAAGGERAQGRGGLRLVRRQLPVRRRGHQLPERGQRRLTVPALLVARRGGAVLPGVAGAALPGRPGLAPAPLHPALGLRRSVGDRRGLVRHLAVDDQGERAVGLLLPAHALGS